MEAVKAVVYIQDEKETQALLFIRELGARLLASTGHEHVISQPHWVSANYRSWEEMDAQTSIAEVLAHFKSELVPFYAALLISDLPWRQQMGLECLELIVDQCKSNL